MSYIENIQGRIGNRFINNSKARFSLLSSLNLVVNELSIINGKNAQERYSGDTITASYLLNFVEKADVPLMILDKNLSIVGVSYHARVWLKRFYSTKSTKSSKDKSIISSSYFKLNDDKQYSMRIACKKVASGKLWKKKLLKWQLSSSKYRWLNMEIIPWFDSSGFITNFVIQFEDVTEKHELELSNKRLQKSNDLLESFNLVLSHDLTQPLRQIANFSDLLTVQYQECKGKNLEIERYFSGMQDSIRHVSNLSEGILLYCKKGEISVASRYVNVKNILESILKSALEKSVNRFCINIDEDLDIYANPITIVQLFQNLFVNAVKFSPENTPITLSAIKDGDYVKFYLHNYGYCDHSVRKRNVFKAFESSKKDGSGIGLMICKKIVSAYNGEILFRSWRRKGTLVTFTLPYKETALNS